MLDLQPAKPRARASSGKFGLALAGGGPIGEQPGPLTASEPGCSIWSLTWEG